MEPPRHILPSNYSSQVPSSIHRPRQPLGESSGNAQPYTLASSGPYHDQNISIYEHGAPKFSLPTLPSQQGHPHLGGQLGMRRDHVRRQREQRRARNPIADSPQYQAYRARQLKDTDGEQKWSAELEEAFLDALTNIPKMGRRKFSLGGKPHGRNELISLYLWIAYLETLPPGATPDQTMMRTRKQVSSHIQVLKGFMRNHPQFEKLFPSRDNPKNGFEDSFKTDPCLIALAKGRLPHRRNRDLEYLPSNGAPQARTPIRPTHFTMAMTSPKPAEDGLTPPGEAELITSHEYCSPSLTAVSRENLENVPHWRRRFPLLAVAQAQGGLDCEIIHISVSLALSSGHMPPKSELWGSFEVQVPSQNDADFRATWRCESSLYKPAGLYGPPNADERYEGRAGIVSVEKYEHGIGSRMRIPFPANPWAHALVKLAEMDNAFHEAREANVPPPLTQSARAYIEQITMYQELFSCSSPQSPWKRRAIIVWTFNKASAGAKGDASWRYLELSPPRQRVFEPLPGQQHMVSAAMTENFNAWAEPMPMQEHASQHHSSMHPQGHFDPLMHGLATPPHTAGLHNPYAGGYPYGPNHSMPAESEISYIGNESTGGDSESQNPHMASLSSSISSHPSTYMSTEHGEMNFDSVPSQNGMWNGSSVPGIESFDGESSFLNNFGNQNQIQHNSWENQAKPEMWEGRLEIAGSGKSEWGSNHNIGPIGGPYEAGISQRMK